MGRRGPIAGAQFGLPTGRPSASRSTPVAVPVDAEVPSDPPEPPDHLGDLGIALWHYLWIGLSVLDRRLDALTVRRLCDLIEERQLYVAALAEYGVIITEPIQSAKGDVVGQRQSINPAEAALRRVDKEITALSDRLALSPAARARLGLLVTSAGRNQAEIQRVLASKYRPTEEDDQ